MAGIKGLKVFSIVTLILILILMLNITTVFAVNYKVKFTGRVNNYSSDLYFIANSSANFCADNYDMPTTDTPGKGVTLYSDFSINYIFNSESGCDPPFDRLSIDSWNGTNRPDGNTNPVVPSVYITFDASRIINDPDYLPDKYGYVNVSWDANYSGDGVIPEMHLYKCNNQACDDLTEISSDDGLPADGSGSYTIWSKPVAEKSVLEKSNTNIVKYNAQSGYGSCTLSCPTNFHCATLSDGPHTETCIDDNNIINYESPCYSGDTSKICARCVSCQGGICIDAPDESSDTRCSGICRGGECTPLIPSKTYFKLKFGDYVETVPAAAPVSSGSGGAFATSAASTIPWTKTIDATSSSDLLASSSGYTTELLTNERVQVAVAGDTHYVGVTETTGNTATVIIMSTPIVVKMNVGQEKKFDLNNDEYYDLYVKLNSVINKKASVLIKSINELIPGTQTTEPTGKDVIGGANKNTTSLNTNQGNILTNKVIFNLSPLSILIFAVISVILIVIAILLLIAYRNRVKKNIEINQSKNI